MKKLFITTVILCFGVSVAAQVQETDTDGGIAFADYEMQIEAKKSEKDSITPPMAITDCELEDTDIVFSYEDVTFSGGKYGTLERTWTATDACGNTATTIQYIALRD